VHCGTSQWVSLNHWTTNHGWMGLDGTGQDWNPKICFSLNYKVITSKYD